VGWKKLSQKTNKTNLYSMNSKEVIKEIRSLLGFSDEAEIEMASALLVDGTEIQWEGELAVGTALFVVTNEGAIPAPDATHEVEGGMLVTTEGGLVTEIVEPAEEEVVVEEELSAEFATVEAFETAIAELKEAIADLNSKMEKYGEKFAAQGEAVLKAVDLVEAIADLPSAEPVKKDEVKLSKKDAQFANIVKIAQSLKK
jgi:hypothetical protein